MKAWFKQLVIKLAIKICKKNDYIVYPKTSSQRKREK